MLRSTVPKAWHIWSSTALKTLLLPMSDLFQISKVFSYITLNIPHLQLPLSLSRLVFVQDTDKDPNKKRKDAVFLCWSRSLIFELVRAW